MSIISLPSKQDIWESLKTKSPDKADKRKPVSKRKKMAAYFFTVSDGSVLFLVEVIFNDLVMLMLT
jgi:hypothetical protein